MTAYNNKKQNTVGINYFKFSGTITKKEFAYSKNGKPFATITVSVPAKNEKYTNKFRLKAFGDQAEAIEKDVKEGDPMVFSGYVSNSSYVDSKTKEKKWSTDFIINAFETALLEDPSREAAQ